MNVGKYRLRWLAALALLLCSAVTLADTISATVDRRELNLDETLRLLVRVSPQANQTPDFSLLENQFDVLSRNQSSQYRNFNGQVEAFTEWQLILAPKNAGKLLIPSFQYGNQFSDAIEIQVHDTNSALGGIKPDIFLELTADLKTPYVQQQVLATLTLYTAVALRIEDAPELNVPGALVIPLNQSQFQKRVDDKVYSVSELRYALFPQQSGELEIPIQTFTVTSGGNNWGGFNRGQIKRIRSQPLTLEVKPQASQFQGKHWLPASNVQLEDNLNDSLTWQVGEPITRRITLRAEGVTADQLPVLALPEVSQIKQYREAPDKSEQKNLNGVNAVITETVALVPTAPGQMQLPAVTLQWWDTNTQQPRTATLPARTISVEGSLPQSALPAPANSAPAAVGTPAIDTSSASVHAGFWPWLTALLLLTNLLSLWLFWRRKPSTGLAESPAIPSNTRDWSALMNRAGRVDSPSDLASCLNHLNALVRAAGYADATAVLQQYQSQSCLQTLQAFQAQVWRAGDAAKDIESRNLVAVVSTIRQLIETQPLAAGTDEPVPDCYPH
ncbi:BatD family protein [Simiduia agarivorans]|uniref:Forkhead-associated protein n=1 Tax=Simiduia agarivorans (strain DSM 21679 / JCM 13881 / BCRC 17597 / SA1) TaxID=1117647 RepID=K4KGU6_SIMAS|nr:BatD family protein [Simiduia agarivorans]AFU97435.1 forkhead-associated protein [Simiduia agarivorans SA1 = DSM 21679]